MKLIDPQPIEYIPGRWDWHEGFEGIRGASTPELQEWLDGFPQGPAVFQDGKWYWDGLDT